MKNTYTIMNLDLKHIDEICNDIRVQYETGVTNCALFSMTLVPEGNPPSDKAGIMCKNYMLFKEKLDMMKVPNGVLVQASIGHGWILGEMFPYQKYIGINGVEENVVCPYDNGFKDYIYDVMHKIALCNPDHIMIDDDFRLMFRNGGGCCCPLHIKRFNELADTDLSREELFAILSGENELKEKYFEIFIQTQRESLIETAKVMRAGIDSVNPKIPGSFCCVGNNVEFAAEISQILAGKENPVVVRINNGNYTPAGARFLSTVFYRAAVSISKLKDKVDIILAETDTCPQNRYSTGAMSLHSHFTGTLLEGAAGAKHWITRLAAYEPESGKAYRKILSKYSGFYRKLSEIVPSLKWRGFRIPIQSESVYKEWKPWNQGEDFSVGWSECVFERLGIPMYFSSENSGVLCLEGKVNFTDEEIHKALKGNVFLASDSASELIERGFGELIGVNVRVWNGKQPSGEELLINGNRTSVQKNIKELIPSIDAYVDSYVCHTTDKVNYTRLFPGTVVYKNNLGGTVVTFAGTPKTNYSITEAFAFLNYSRKQQLINLIKKMNELPAYYPGDEEVYLRVADMPENKLFCAVFNIGLDPIDELEIVFERKVTGFKMLMPDGTLQDLPFRCEENKYILNTPCYTLTPVIIIAE